MRLALQTLSTETLGQLGSVLVAEAAGRPLTDAELEVASFQCSVSGRARSHALACDAMKRIYTRVGRLELRFEPMQFSPREQELLERIEAGCRRVAQLPATKPELANVGSFCRSLNIADSPERRAAACCGAVSSSNGGRLKTNIAARLRTLEHTLPNQTREAQSITIVFVDSNRQPCRELVIQIPSLQVPRLRSH